MELRDFACSQIAKYCRSRGSLLATKPLSRISSAKVSSFPTRIWAHATNKYITGCVDGTIKNSQTILRKKSNISEISVRFVDVSAIPLPVRKQDKHALENRMKNCVRTSEMSFLLAFWETLSQGMSSLMACAISCRKIKHTALEVSMQANVIRDNVVTTRRVTSSSIWSARMKLL